MILTFHLCVKAADSFESDLRSQLGDIIMLKNELANEKKKNDEQEDW